MTPSREVAMSKLVIRKYKNRRLYSPETGTYVTAQTLAELIKLDVDFVVIDHVSGHDITQSVLMQTFSELEERSSTKIFSADMLRQLIALSQSNSRSVQPLPFEQVGQGLVSDPLKLRVAPLAHADSKSGAAVQHAAIAELNNSHGEDIERP